MGLGQLYRGDDGVLVVTPGPGRQGRQLPGSGSGAIGTNDQGSMPSQPVRGVDNCALAGGKVS